MLHDTFLKTATSIGLQKYTSTTKIGIDYCGLFKNKVLHSIQESDIENLSDQMHRGFPDQVPLYTYY
jgi:hypothetical protein